MLFATCPRCMHSYAFEMPDDRTRIACPNCLRNFDPFKPLPDRPEPVVESEKSTGDAEAPLGDECLVDPTDQTDAEPDDPYLTSGGDVEPDTDEDFAEGS